MRNNKRLRNCEALDFVLGLIRKEEAITEKDLLRKYERAFKIYSISAVALHSIIKKLTKDDILAKNDEGILTVEYAAEIRSYCVDLRLRLAGITTANNRNTWKYRMDWFNVSRNLLTFGLLVSTFCLTMCDRVQSGKIEEQKSRIRIQVDSIDSLNSVIATFSKGQNDQESSDVVTPEPL